MNFVKHSLSEVCSIGIDLKANSLVNEGDVLCTETKPCHAG